MECNIRQVAVTLASSLVLAGVLAAQTLQTVTASSSNPEPTTGPSGRHRLTLEEAQQKAAPRNPTLERLEEFQVEAARQHRLGVRSDFFPKLGADFANLHYNKFMGQQIQIVRPIAGTTASISAPLIGKDETLVAASATQPITPLFKLRRVYDIARADERIARAKAGMPVAETSAKVEKDYYQLLIAQRQLDFSRASAKSFENKWLQASSSTPTGLAGHQEDLLEMSKALAVATIRVQELTASLNELLGWPPETELELVPPEPLYEAISLKQATAQALAGNPEVVEAEQTLVKARAASSLSKLDYVPDVAVMGGYVYNGNVAPLLPRDFSLIGVIATYNLFDFGKREHTIKERHAQVGMAETALQLTKAKVSASVKSSYLELERLRQLSELTHRLSSAIRVRQASDRIDNPEIAASRAKFETEMFQADLDYRQQLVRLRILMGGR